MCTFCISSIFDVKFRRFMSFDEWDNLTNYTFQSSVCDCYCHNLFISFNFKHNKYKHAHCTVTNYPPNEFLIVVQSGSELPVVPACVTTIK